MSDKCDLCEDASIEVETTGLLEATRDPALLMTTLISAANFVLLITLFLR